jgi:hypothetical protein
MPAPAATDQQVGLLDQGGGAFEIGGVHGCILMMCGIHDKYSKRLL